MCSANLADFIDVWTALLWLPLSGSSAAVSSIQRLGMSAMRTAVQEPIVLREGDFFLASEHEECWSRLLYVVEQQCRLAVLFGGAEVGKSCLLRGAAAQVVRRDRLQWFQLDVSGLTIEEFAVQLGDISDAGSADRSPWQAIEDWLWGSAASGQRTLWTIDHVDQALDEMSLAIRRFTRLIEHTRAPASVVVCTRGWSHVASLSDLVDLSCELPPWSLESTSAWLNRPLGSGKRLLPFSRDAVQAAYDCMQGVAGRVQRLQQLCRLAAELRDSEEVDIGLVLEVWGELMSPLSHESRSSGR